MEEKRMPISEHLRELRARLVVCLVAVLLMAVVGYVLCPSVFYRMLRAPLDTVAGNPTGNPYVVSIPGRDALIARYRAGAPEKTKALLAAATQLRHTSVIDPFLIRLKIALVVGILLALPVIVYEAWAFVAAGLYPHERRGVLVYGPASLGLFLLGVAVGYFLVLPLGVIFLMEQGAALDLQPTLMLKEYVPFVLWPLLGFGLVFQLPLVVLFLTRLGVVGPAGLTRHRRHAILVMVVVAAFLTPPDVFTQIAMAIPMVFLYEFSILLSRMAARKRARGA